MLIHYNFLGTNHDDMIQPMQKPSIGGREQSFVEDTGESFTKGAKNLEIIGANLSKKQRYARSDAGGPEGNVLTK